MSSKVTEYKRSLSRIVECQKAVVYGHLRNHLPNISICILRMANARLRRTCGGCSVAYTTCAFIEHDVGPDVLRQSKADFPVNEKEQRWRMDPKLFYLSSNLSLLLLYLCHYYYVVWRRSRKRSRNQPLTQVSFPIISSVSYIVRRLRSSFESDFFHNLTTPLTA